MRFVPSGFPCHTLEPANPAQQNPEPLTLNPEPLTLNPEPLTLNPEPLTLNPSTPGDAPGFRECIQPILSQPVARFTAPLFRLSGNACRVLRVGCWVSGMQFQGSGFGVRGSGFGVGLGLGISSVGLRTGQPIQPSSITARV